MSPSLKPTTDPQTVRVRLFRYDPAADSAPRYEDYAVPYTPRMRVMDALDYIYEDLAVDFGYRWLCGSKKCGTCALKVNGTPKLVCWEPAVAQMTIEPLDNLPVLRDLVTSRDPYDEFLARLRPTLQREKEYTAFPEPLTAVQMAPTAHLRECVQCLCCHSVCPVLKQPDTGFAGPALLVALSELAQDPRDDLDRAALAAKEAQVFKCVSCYECERVCPTDIPIVHDAIEPLKRLAFREGSEAGARRAAGFLELVKSRGRVSGALLALKTKGLGLDELKLAMRMVRSGKINLKETLFGEAAPGAEAIRKTYDASEK